MWQNKAERENPWFILTPWGKGLMERLEYDYQSIAIRQLRNKTTKYVTNNYFREYFPKTNKKVDWISLISYLIIMRDRLDVQLRFDKIYCLQSLILELR